MIDFYFNAFKSKNQIKIQEISSILGQHPYYVKGQQSIQFAINQLQLSWKNNCVPYKQFLLGLQKCIGDYDLFQKKECILVEKSTITKIKKYYYKLQDFFVNNEYESDEAAWELLLMTIKIKDIVGLLEREAEWVVVTLMQRINSTQEWIVGKPLVLIQGLISSDGPREQLLLSNKIIEENEEDKSDKKSQNNSEKQEINYDDDHYNKEQFSDIK